MPPVAIETGCRRGASAPSTPIRPNSVLSTRQSLGQARIKRAPRRHLRVLLLRITLSKSQVRKSSRLWHIISYFFTLPRSRHSHAGISRGTASTGAHRAKRHRGALRRHWGEPTPQADQRSHKSRTLRSTRSGSPVRSRRMPTSRAPCPSRPRSASSAPTSLLQPCSARPRTPIPRSRKRTRCSSRARPEAPTSTTTSSCR